MTNDTSRIKWHAVDVAAAQALTSITSSPGVIYPIGTNALPLQLQAMPGIASYYASAYTTGQPLPIGVTVGGEMLAVRTGVAITKNDQFVFGTSSNGQVCFAGPFQGYGHHLRSGQSVPVHSLFNQTPFSTKS